MPSKDEKELTAEKFKAEKVKRNEKAKKLFKNPKHSALLAEIEVAETQEEIATKIKVKFGVTGRVELG